jgi:hypothetical protein
MVKPGLFKSSRSPYRISCNNVVIAPPEWLTLNAISRVRSLCPQLSRAPRRYVARQKYNHHEDEWYSDKHFRINMPLSSEFVTIARSAKKHLSILRAKTHPTPLVLAIT